MSRATRNGWARWPEDDPITGAWIYRKTLDDGWLTVLVGPEPPGFHMSISHPGRYPTWDEIREARYEFCPPAATMAMLLPPLEEYVNVHENTFHLWEIDQ